MASDPWGYMDSVGSVLGDAAGAMAGALEAPSDFGGKVFDGLHDVAYDVSKVGAPRKGLDLPDVEASKNLDGLGGLGDFVSGLSKYASGSEYAGAGKMASGGLGMLNKGLGMFGKKIPGLGYATNGLETAANFAEAVDNREEADEGYFFNDDGKRNAFWGAAGDTKLSLAHTILAGDPAADGLLSLCELGADGLGMGVGMMRDQAESLGDFTGLYDMDDEDWRFGAGDLVGMMMHGENELIDAGMDLGRDVLDSELVKDLTNPYDLALAAVPGAAGLVDVADTVTDTVAEYIPSLPSLSMPSVSVPSLW